MKNLIILDHYSIKNLIKIIFSVSIFYFLFLFIAEKINISTFFYLSFLFFVNYSLLYLYISSKNEKNYFPIFPLILIFYLITYSSFFYIEQKMYMVNFINSSNHGILTSSNTLELFPFLILIITSGLISFSLGYFAPNIVNNNHKKKLYEFKNINRFEYLLLLFFSAVLAFYYFNYPNRYISLSFLGQLKEPLILFILAYFQIKYLQSKKTLIFVLNIFLVTIFFIIELSFGSVVFPYLLIGFIISINYYKTKKINLIHIFLIFISLFFVHSLKDDLRKVTWKNYHVDKDYNEVDDKSVLINKNENKEKNKNSSDNSEVVNNVSDTIKLLIEKPQDSDFLNFSVQENNLSYQKKRLFHSIISLQIVIDQTPKNIDYFNNKSYSGFYKKILPRFINKNKPKELWGNFWGQRYGILDPSDKKTSWNFPILNEFYANNGLIGVIIGMFLLGLLVKTLLIIPLFNTSSAVICAAFFTVIFNFFYQESNLTLLLGKVVNQIIFFTIIFTTIHIGNYFLKKIINFKT